MTDHLYSLYLSDDDEKQLKADAKYSGLSTIEEYVNYVMRSLYSGGFGRSEAPALLALFGNTQPVAGEYTPADYFAPQITKRQGNKQHVSARLPSDIHDAMIQIINRESTPYVTSTEFVVDAIWHRIQQVRLYMLEDDWADHVLAETSTRRLEAALEERRRREAIISQTIERIDLVKNDPDVTDGEIARTLRRTLHELEDLYDDWGEIVGDDLKMRLQDHLFNISEQYAKYKQFDTGEYQYLTRQARQARGEEIAAQFEDHSGPMTETEVEAELLAERVVPDEIVAEVRAEEATMAEQLAVVRAAKREARIDQILDLFSSGHLSKLDATSDLAAIVGESAAVALIGRATRRVN